MIKLTADETRLLMAAKGRAIKGVSNRFALGSMDYIQDVVNARCGSEKDVSIFHPYMNLAKKIIRAQDFAILLDSLYRRMENPFFVQQGDEKISKATMELGLVTVLAMTDTREFELNMEWVR